LQRANRTFNPQFLTPNIAGTRNQHPLHLRIRLLSSIYPVLTVKELKSEEGTVLPKTPTSREAGAGCIPDLATGVRVMPERCEQPIGSTP